MAGTEVIFYTGGMDTVRKLILDRLAAIGLNMSEASVKIGRNHAYLQQFLKRGIPSQLHERDRERLAELLKVSPDELRGSSHALPPRGYEKKSPTVAQSLVEDSTTAPYTQHNNEAARQIPGAELFGKSLDLPVFATAQGGEGGALIISGNAVDWVARPTVLLRVQDGYGMIVSGDSMSPEHKSGSIALVNPHIPPRAGDSCVFRSHAEDGTDYALIKEYRGQTETAWKVRQHNPQKDFTLPKAKWQLCHKTVGNYFP